MRGSDERSKGLFSSVSCEARVPATHPLRPVRAIVDEALEEMSPAFEGLCSKIGRPSIPPEKLLRALLSDERFSVDGTLIEAWASVKSFRPKDGNGERDFHGEKRSNETHASTSDPEARLYRKGNGQPAKLAFMGHALMENRHALVVDVRFTAATGLAERAAAISMVEAISGCHRITMGADKAYDTKDFVANLRGLGAAPHVAQNTSNRRSAIDGRTTRHPGYAVSLRIRKRIEEVFGDSVHERNHSQSDSESASHNGPVPHRAMA